MTQFRVRKDELLASAVQHGPKARPLHRGAVAGFVLGAPDGAVLALGGLDGESLRGIIEQAEPRDGGRLALFARIIPEPTSEAIVEQVISILAGTVRRLWPVWFTDVSFRACGDDTLGRLALGAIARGAAKQIPQLSPSWVESAGRLALQGRLPRVSGTPLAIELRSLALAVNRAGLVFVTDVSRGVENAPNPHALVRALEWLAEASQGAVIAVFGALPPCEPPFDRILHDAREVTSETAGPPVDAVERGDQTPEAWLAPWQGLPHPLSEIEQRLARAIGGDKELASLFGFNQFVETVRGSRPKVDLVWRAGRLVVELDGYGAHGNRSSFLYDRHRDYELTLSGYAVLRLANEEIAQDTGRAIEKIRDLVRLRRTQVMEED